MVLFLNKKRVTQNSIYSDVSNNPKVNFKIFDFDSISQAMENIFMVSKKTRFFNPEFGADIEDLLWELMSEDIAFQIFDKILNAIDESGDDRINIDYGSSFVVPNYETHLYEVTLVVLVEGIESDNRFEYVGSIPLKRSV